MSNQRQKSTKAITNQNGERVTPVTGLPASQRVESPPCKSCKSTNTFVYNTRHVIRYCKCRRCGWTYSYTDPVDAKWAQIAKDITVQADDAAVINLKTR